MEKEFTAAQMTVDKFHVLKLLNESVDEVRREEQREQPELKKSRYLWLRNPENLNKKQEEKLTTLSQMNLVTGRAYRDLGLHFKTYGLFHLYSLTCISTSGSSGLFAAAFPK